MVSFLPLEEFRAIPKFVRYTRQIQRQLAGSEGLIGYSMDANVVGKEFWTSSVWEDAQALRRFVHRTPHDEIMGICCRRWGKRSSCNGRRKERPSHPIGVRPRSASESCRPREHP